MQRPSVPSPFPAVGAGPQYWPAAIVGTETPGTQGGGSSAGWDRACAAFVVSGGTVLSEDDELGDTLDDTAGETNEDAWLVAQPAVTATKTATAKMILTVVVDDKPWPLSSPGPAGASDTCIVSVLGAARCENRPPPSVPYRRDCLRR